MYSYSTSRPFTNTHLKSTTISVKIFDRYYSLKLYLMNMHYYCWFPMEELKNWQLSSFIKTY